MAVRKLPASSRIHVLISRPLDEALKNACWSKRRATAVTAGLRVATLEDAPYSGPKSPDGHYIVDGRKRERAL